MDYELSVDYSGSAKVCVFLSYLGGYVLDVFNAS